MEALMLVGMFAVVACIFVAVVLYGRHQLDLWNQALGQVADSLGLAYREGGWGGTGAASGQLDDIELTIDTYTTGGKNKTTWTRWTIRDPHGPAASLAPEGALAFIGKALGGTDLQIGDPSFDARVLVRAEDPLDLRVRLDHEARQLMLDGLSAGWALSEGQWTRSQRGYVHDAGRLEAVARGGLEVCRGLRIEGTRVEAARRLIDSDPHRDVRVEVLESWLTHSRPDDSVLAELADAHPNRVGLVAARESGDLDRICRFLDHPKGEIRLQAALIAAGLGAASAAIEAELVGGLEEVEHADACIEALGRVGSIAAVEALSVFSVGTLPSARKRSAIQAIRTIQALQVGAEAGQVSVVEAQGGELSVSSTQRQGQLSAAKPRTE